MNEAPTFGQVVKERRSAMGLTQTELARRVGCAAITIRKIEADGLRPSVQMAELLALALNIPEAEQLAFVRLARAELGLSPIPTPSPTPGEIGLTDLSGRAVKGFHLGERIGSGGFGVVYRALQPSVEREVAVKIILPRYANHPNFIRRFEAEARLIARLEHPHIVPLYDYWREPDAAYLIMRLLRGGSLEDQIKNGPLPLERVSQYTRQIGLALDVAHRHGIIHRDIKPANVLLDEEGNAYLADFGIAKNLEGVNGHNLTEDGVLVGSPAYISPEQIKAEPVKPQSDIYCLGIMLFEMLTGHKPFTGPTPFAYIHQHLTETLPPLQKYNANLPPELDAVIRRATARNASERYRDVPSLLAALQSVLSAAAPPHPLPAETMIELSAPQWAEVTNPYQGLRAFSEAEADHFRGRATLIQELFAQLSDGSELARFLAIVGPSGSGKSSVAKAGLVPALRRGGLPGSENWFIVDITPGAHPWEEVEAALLRIAINPPETLLGQMQEGDRGLLRAVRRVLPDDGLTELVLIIDQFEELFTLVTDEAVREQFLNSLVTAVLDDRSPLRVIVTLRADFYDRPLQYVDFGDLLRQRTVSVLPLTPDELEQAIVQPAAQVGVRLEAGLAAAIIRDVGDQPGTLPLLQYALTELFEQRQGNMMTRAAYDTMGGVTGALARRADEIYAGLSADGQAATRQLFLRLITLGEGVEDTRRRVRLSELEALSPQSSLLTPQPLDSFGRYRLLTFDRDPITREPTVEVAHEALLREWGRLRGWLGESRDDIRRQRVLADAAAQWQIAAQDASYLLRGNRLTEFVTWAETTTLALTTPEQTFLHTSLADRQQRQADERVRQERELTTARQLAETERRRAEEQAQAAQGLRRRAYYLAVVLLLTLIVAAYASWVSGQNVILAEEKATSLAQSEQLRLAAEANSALVGNNTGDLAALLALRSLQDGYSAQADEALLGALARGLGQQHYPWLAGYFDNSSIVQALGFSADGRYLLSSSSLAGRVTLWDVKTGQAEQAYFNPGSNSDLHGQVVLNFAFLPDGHSFLMAKENFSVEWIDRETGEIKDSYRTLFLPLDIAVASNGQFFLAGGEGGFLILVHLDTGEIKRWNDSSYVVTALALTPDNKMVISGSNAHTVRLWDLETGETRQIFEGHEGTITNIVVSPDGQLILTSSLDGTARLWDVATGVQLHRIEIGPFSNKPFLTMLDPARRTPFGLAFAPDSQRYLVSDSEQNVQLWDVTTNQLIHSWAGVGGASIAFSPDGQTIASANRNRLFSWVVPPATEPLILRGHTGDVADIAFASDGETILSGGLEGIARLWDVATGHLQQQSPQHTDFDYDENPVRDVEFTAESDLAMLAIGFSRWIGVAEWDLETEVSNYVTSFNWQTSATSNGILDLSAQGKYVILPGYASDIDIWGILYDGQSQEVIQRFSYSVDKPEALVAYFVAISPDGRWVLTPFGHNYEAQLWDVATGEQVGVLSGHAAAIGPMAFSPENDFALIGSLDGTARLWDIQTREEIQRFVVPGVSITAVAFSPDGEFIATGSDDNKVRLWNVATGEQIRVFAGHAERVTVVTFSPDGQLIASGSEDDTIRIWHVDINYAVELACAQLTRDFTDAERVAYNIPDNRPTCPTP